MATDHVTTGTVPTAELLVDRVTTLTRETNVLAMDALATLAEAEGEEGFAPAAKQARRLADSVLSGFTAGIAGADLT